MFYNNRYGKNVIYEEGLFDESYMALVDNLLQATLLLPAFLLPDFIKYKLIPPPGDGPDVSRGFLEVVRINN